MELHIDLECPQGPDDIKIPTPMELHIDLDFPRGSDDIKIPTRMELHIDLECPQGSDDIQETSEITLWNVIDTHRQETFEWKIVCWSACHVVLSPGASSDSDLEGFSFRMLVLVSECSFPNPRVLVSEAEFPNPRAR